MDRSYETAVKDIKSHLISLERKSGLRLLFAAIIAGVLITLVVIYLVLKFRTPDLTDEYYDFEDADEDSFPFDEDEEDFEDEEYPDGEA
ncbi:MAG: hypothetical protein LUG66_03095 [Clostridiales bacterium]|nr:hypothetical protein [Clostridiales bacterium]